MVVLKMSFKHLTSLGGCALEHKWLVWVDAGPDGCCQFIKSKVRSDYSWSLVCTSGHVFVYV